MQKGVLVHERRVKEEAGKPVCVCCECVNQTALRPVGSSSARQTGKQTHLPPACPAVSRHGCQGSSAEGHPPPRAGGCPEQHTARSRTRQTHAHPHVSTLRKRAAYQDWPPANSMSPGVTSHPVTSHAWCTPGCAGGTTPRRPSAQGAACLTSSAMSRGLGSSSSQVSSSSSGT